MQGGISVLYVGDAEVVQGYLGLGSILRVVNAEPK